MKIKDIKIGKSFIYNGYNYTKLNEDNLCIIDDYEGKFMSCIFDPMDNDYSYSLIRSYINSNRFINKLFINSNDIEFCNGDFLTLLSKEEYKKYQGFIKEYSRSWWLRSGDFVYHNLACFVFNTGSVSYSGVNVSFGVRPALQFKPNVIVKGVK